MADAIFELSVLDVISMRERPTSIRGRAGRAPAYEVDRMPREFGSVYERSVPLWLWSKLRSGTRRGAFDSALFELEGETGVSIFVSVAPGGWDVVVTAGGGDAHATGLFALRFTALIGDVMLA